MALSKFAGYDQVIVQGRAEHPVYLWIKDDVIELRDARELWGQHVWDTTQAIWQELGDPDVQVAAIGQGAENGVRFAGVFVNPHRAAARTGMGTVMASKNLKAVAVRGTGLIPVADMGRFGEIVEQLDEAIYNHPEYEIRCRLGTTKLIKALNAIGGLPTHHFQCGCFEEVDTVSGEAIEELYKIKSKSVLCVHHSVQSLPGGGRSALLRPAPGGAGIRAIGRAHGSRGQRRPGTGPQVH